MIMLANGIVRRHRRDVAAVRIAPPTMWVSLVVLAGGLAAVGCGGAEDDTEEPPVEPLFSIAVITDTHITTSPENVDRLTAAVDWIDDHASEQQIELVLVLGDIGWGQGLGQAKSLLDELDVPYVPLVGDNELHAGDDETFHTTFAPQFQLLEATVDHWRHAPVPVWDPEAEMDGWFQNLAFDYRGLHLFAVDLCIRGDDTIMGEFGDLHEFEGGTWPWLTEQLAALAPTRQESILVLSHIPMFQGLLDNDEMPQVDGLLEPMSDFVYANLAGHLHGNLLSEGAGFDVYVTDATHDDENTVRIIEVSGNELRFAYTHSLVVVP
jgi:hypothetical protein